MGGSQDAAIDDCPATHSRGHSEANRPGIDGRLRMAAAMRGSAPDCRADRRTRAPNRGEAMTPTLQAFLVVSAALFSIGLLAVLSRRHAVFILIGIEMMLAAANLNFIAFWRFA